MWTVWNRKNRMFLNFFDLKNGTECLVLSNHWFWTGNLRFYQLWRREWQTSTHSNGPKTLRRVVRKWRETSIRSREQVEWISLQPTGKSTLWNRKHDSLWNIPRIKKLDSERNRTLNRSVSQRSNYSDFFGTVIRWDMGSEDDQKLQNFSPLDSDNMPVWRIRLKLKESCQPAYKIYQNF